MVHAPFRWEYIGDVLDGDLTGQSLSELEADLIRIFEEDDAQLGRWLDWYLDSLEASLEASLDYDGQVWMEGEFTRAFEEAGVSQTPFANQSEPSE